MTDLDEKALEAANTAAGFPNVRCVQVEAGIRAYLDALPQPIGVVEALRECVTYIRSPLRMARDEDEEARRAKVIDRAVAALASLAPQGSEGGAK